MGQVEPREFSLKGGQMARIRSAVPEDAQQLIEFANQIILREAHNVTVPEEFNYTAEQEAAWIREHTEKPGWLVLTAWIDQSPVGMLACENGIRQRIAHIAAVHLSVHWQYRRQGVATALLTAAIDWAKNNPAIDKMSLSVFATNNGAIELYRRIGFVEEGRRIREVKLREGQYVDDILMYRWVGP